MQDHPIISHIDSIAVACGRCGCRDAMRQYPCIDCSLQPEGKELLLERAFFQFTCPQCGFSSEFAYPCRYLDDKAGLTVVLVPQLEGDTEQALQTITAINQRTDGLLTADRRYRVVGSFYAMQEQVRVRDAGLDDRVINLLKPLIIGQLQSRGMEVWNGFFQGIEDRRNEGPAQNTVYVALDGDQTAAQQEPVYWYDIFLTNGEVLRQGINRSGYHLCEQMVAGKADDGQYHLYDLSWAISVHRQNYGGGEEEVQ